MTRNFVCSECGGNLVPGVVPDYTHGAIDRLGWVEGFPKFNLFGGLKINRKTKYYFITAYRCERCGLLKLYAGSDQSSDTQK